jgi:hypothetical protein
MKKLGPFLPGVPAVSRATLYPWRREIQSSAGLIFGARKLVCHELPQLAAARLRSAHGATIGLVIALSQFSGLKKLEEVLSIHLEFNSYRYAEIKKIH